MLRDHIRSHIQQYLHDSGAGETANNHLEGLTEAVMEGLVEAINEQGPPIPIPGPEGVEADSSFGASAPVVSESVDGLVDGRRIYKGPETTNALTAQSVVNPRNPRNRIRR